MGFRKKSALLLCMLILCLPSACSYGNRPQVVIGDGGLISGEPCSAPCFWNINPGITTEKEALQILSQKLNVKNCDSWDKDESGRDKGIRCESIGITFDNNIVNTVSFRPSEIVTVEELMEKYGAPDGIFVAALGISAQPPIAMMLYFDTVNMVIHLPEQDSRIYNLQSDTLVESVVYMSKTEYLSTKNLRQEWTGYGGY